MFIFNIMMDDFEWVEGSFGIRFGGICCDFMLCCSFFVLVMSFSIVSLIIIESEDELFEGIILFYGLLDLGERF